MFDPFGRKATWLHHVLSLSIKNMTNIMYHWDESWTPRSPPCLLWI